MTGSALRSARFFPVVAAVGLSIVPPATTIAAPLLEGTCTGASGPSDPQYAPAEREDNRSNGHWGPDPDVRRDCPAPVASLISLPR